MYFSSSYHKPSNNNNTINLFHCYLLVFIITIIILLPHCLHTFQLFFSSGFSRNLFQKTKQKIGVEMAPKIGEKAVRKEKPGNGGAGTHGKTAADWKDVDTLLPIGPVIMGEIKQRYGVFHFDGGYNFIYFPCRQQRSRGCKFRMRWAKQGGLLQQHGRHNHGVKKAPAKQQQQKQAAMDDDWQQKMNAKGGVRQICADHGVCQINNNNGSNNEEEVVHFCCMKPRCHLRVKWLLADGTVWTLGKHEQH